ncbi:MAG: tetratricopeptide repeat protein, partial [Marinilabiliales bacterium]|nr:tetratricopeptide repeat protein [Marinilabiliales bacterium]
PCFVQLRIAKVNARAPNSFLQHLETAFFLGKLYYGAGRYSEALEYALQSIRKDRKSPKAYNLQGVVLNQLGRHAEAAGSFQAGLVLAPEDIGLQVNLGIAYINGNEPAKAKPILEAVLPKITDGVLKKRIEEYLGSIKYGPEVALDAAAARASGGPECYDKGMNRVTVCTDPTALRRRRSSRTCSRNPSASPQGSAPKPSARFSG